MYKHIVLSIFLAGLFGCDGAGTWSSTRFNAADWRATEEKDRYVWANDLVASGELIGVDTEAVVKLLGPPSLDRSPEYVEYIIKRGGSGFTKLYFWEIKLTSGRVAAVAIKGD